MTLNAALVTFLTVDFTKTLVSRFGDWVTGKFTVSIQKVHFQ